MLIALEQLLVSAKRAADLAAGRAIAAKVRHDRNAEAFARGELKALEALMGPYVLAVEQGRLPDLGQQVALSAFARGVAYALAVERFLVWLDSIAQAGLGIEEANRKAITKAEFAENWLRNGP